MHPSIRNICACSLFALPTIAAAISLSGRMVTTGSTPKGVEGVTVSLAGSSLSAQTDGQGAWSLGDPVGVVAKIRNASPATSSHLRVSQGRLQVVLGDRDVLGRTGSPWPSSPRGATVSARISAAAPDTLIYSFGGKVFLRDTLTTLSQTGIVRVFDTTINPAITYGHFTDVRDGQTYRTVKIGSQIWMAQNLNYSGRGFCPGDSGTKIEGTADTCSKYGRIYSWWDAAKTVVGTGYSYNGLPGVCPTGWHLPTDKEWQRLEVALGMDSAVATMDDLRGSPLGTKLKSRTGWYNARTGAHDTGGTDDYGFRVLPAGYRYADSYFDYKGRTAFLWSRTNYASDWYWRRYFDASEEGIDRYMRPAAHTLSVRCVKD